MALLSSHLLAPGVCLHVCGMCVAGVGLGVGRGGPAFLSTAQEINSWVWSRLFILEPWSLKSLIVTLNLTDACVLSPALWGCGQEGQELRRRCYALQGTQRG